MAKKNNHIEIENSLLNKATLELLEQKNIIKDLEKKLKQAENNIKEEFDIATGYHKQVQKLKKENEQLKAIIKEGEELILYMARIKEFACDTSDMIYHYRNKIKEVNNE